MERPLTPVQVPVPTLKDSTDIRVYVEIESGTSVAACMFCFLTALTLTNIYAVCTSLHGTRSVKDFLALLKDLIVPDDFHLETLKDRRIVDISGAIGPGEYIAGALISALRLINNIHFFLATSRTFRKLWNRPTIDI
jgi:hypothetical protein